MFKKLKKFLFLFILGGLMFFLSSKTSLAQVEEIIFSFSLNFQKILYDILNKISLSKESDTYKEKYFELLQELARLRLSLKEIREANLITISEKYKERKVEVSVLKKDELGNIFISNFKGIKEGMVVLDQNWILVGRVSKVYENYSVVSSLFSSNLEFNVSDFNDNLLGLAKSISNGFLEIQFALPQTEIKEGDFILSYGGDIFPSGFLVGSVSKVIKSSTNQKNKFQTNLKIQIENSNHYSGTNRPKNNKN